MIITLLQLSNLSSKSSSIIIMLLHTHTHAHRINKTVDR